MFYIWLKPDFIWLLPSLWLSLLLLDLDYITPSNQNLWQFLVNTVTHVSFWIYRNSLPYWNLITTEWILCIISTACLSLLLIETTYVYCYSCNKSIWCSMVSIIIMLWQIIFDMITILFCYGCIDYDYIVSHMVWFTA